MSLYVLIYRKESKSDNSGRAPLYLRITLDGSRSEISLNERVEAARWDANKCRVKGSSEEARRINFKIERDEHGLKVLHEKLVARHGRITAQFLKDTHTGKLKNTCTLLEAFNYHNEREEKLSAVKGAGMADGTLKNYKATRKKLDMFLETKGMKDISFDILNLKFVYDFNDYLLVKHGLKVNAANNHIKRLRKVLAIALEHGWMENDFLRRIKVKSEPTEGTWLDEAELIALETYDFESEELALVRDIFIFSCYTGLSYSDAMAMSEDWISLDKEGYKWVKSKRKKTGGKFKFMLRPEALAIMETYSSHPDRKLGAVIPYRTDQHINRTLKDIAALVGIKKNVTHHVARHTFATHLRLRGVPSESIAEMMGHNDIRSTMHYAASTDEGLRNEMLTAFPHLMLAS